MDVLPKLGSVFALAFVYSWASVPAGLALQVTPILVALTAWVSYIAGVVIIVLLGEPIRAGILRRFEGRVAASSNSPIQRGIGSACSACRCLRPSLPDRRSGRCSACR